MKKIKISIAGALGRMGQILIKKSKINKYVTLQSLTDIKVGKKINTIKIQKNSVNAFKNSDVIIDFSNPKSSIEVLKIANKLKKKVIIGTTGFNLAQEKIIKNISKNIAIFKSGNMSLGINLLEHITKILSKKIPQDYQINITDNHHTKKIDYPSGTALMLANAVAKGKNKKLNLLKGNIFLNKKGKIKKNKINFFVARKGKTIGEHTIEINNGSEKIELKHVAFSRELFADGAINAAVWINNKKSGLFNMQDMLSLN